MGLIIKVVMDFPQDGNGIISKRSGFLSILLLKNSLRSSQRLSVLSVIVLFDFEEYS